MSGNPLILTPLPPTILELICAICPPVYGTAEKECRGIATWVPSPHNLGATNIIDEDSLSDDEKRMIYEMVLEILYGEKEEDEKGTTTTNH